MYKKYCIALRLYTKSLVEIIINYWASQLQPSYSGMISRPVYQLHVLGM